MTTKKTEIKKEKRGGARAGSGRKKTGLTKTGKIERINLEVLAKLTEKKEKSNKTWSEFLAYLLNKTEQFEKMY